MSLLESAETSLRMEKGRSMWLYIEHQVEHYPLYTLRHGRRWCRWRKVDAAERLRQDDDDGRGRARGGYSDERAVDGIESLERGVHGGGHDRRRKEVGGLEQGGRVDGG